MGRRRELERWGSWCKRKRPRPVLEDVGSEQILEYIKSRTHFHSKASVAGVMSILRNAGEFLVERGYWRSNPLRWMRGPKLDPRAHLPSRAGKEQMQRIWIEAGKLKSEYQRVLWVTVLAILYGTGIRRGELERLKLKDWDRETGLLKVDGQKTGQERAVPVPEAVWSCLESYLPQRHNMLAKCCKQEQERLLVVQGGTPLRGERVGMMIHTLADRAGVEFMTVHQFRHTCASELIEGGVGLAQVQRILGHSCIQTTFRYIQTSAPERKLAMALHPINEILGVLPEEGARCA
jgi:integrase/recombinase XerD